jgi:F420-dependent oxidoreductase-like protein
MRIGLSGSGSSIERIIDQARAAEADGFSSLWYPSTIGIGDPLVAAAVAGRETTSIELGTAVLQTYPCHPLLLASRVTAACAVMGRPGLTVGVGPSHPQAMELSYGIPYRRPGAHTEEYVTILSQVLQGRDVYVDGDLLKAQTMGIVAPTAHPVSLLVGALGPRLLRVAREHADGAVLWMANHRAISEHVRPRIGAERRIVAGLPVAVHDDVPAARRKADKLHMLSSNLPNYRRVIEAGGAQTAGDVALVGDEASVSAQIDEVFAAGATDLWAAVFTVGDRDESRTRTRALLAKLASGVAR